MHRHTLAALALALGTFAPQASLAAQARIAAPTTGPASPTALADGAPRVQREEWQRLPDIFAALGAKPGARVADLGSAEGWLTVRLAKAVGPEGRVFAADINERALRTLAQTLASDDGLRNVELVLSEPDDPRLPYASLDGVVIVNSYHEMERRVPVLDGIMRSLKPGGILVIVDNVPADTLRTRKAQTARHALALELARDDLESHGFEVVTSAPDFIVYDVTHDGRAMTHRQWMLVVRRRVQ